jgi:hypothetical protein
MLAHISQPTASGKEIVSLEWGDTTLRIGPFQRAMPDGRSATSWNTPPLPFGRTAFLRLTADEIVYGIPDRYEYEVYSREGRHLRTVRAALPPVPVTRADIAEARESLMRVPSTAEMRAGFTKALDQVRFPSTMPAYGALETEPDGTVWMRSYSRTTPPDYWWARFDRSGKLLGTLRLPPDRSLVRFTNGHVLLSRRDADDAVVLYVHRIEPIPRGEP